MSEDDRLERVCRLFLWGIALLHLVCLLLIRHNAEPPAPQQALTHFASAAMKSTIPESPVPSGTRHLR